MRYWARQGLATAVLALIAACPFKALALDMPGPSAQEVLVKSILVTLNDAVASDNFTILHAKISKPFREQFPPDKLRAVFKDLVDPLLAVSKCPDLIVNRGHLFGTVLPDQDKRALIEFLKTF